MLKLLRPECRSVQRVLWDYANHRLCEGRLEKVERHLPKCAACQRELRSLQQAQGLLTNYKKQTVPPPDTGWGDLQHRLMAEGLIQSPLAAFECETRQRRLPQFSMRRGDRSRAGFGRG